MTAEELKENILKTSNETIRISREMCNNNFSENVEFLIRRFVDGDLNFLELNKLRKKNYRK
jgi:hypothetical protein